MKLGAPQRPRWQSFVRRVAFVASLVVCAVAATLAALEESGWINARVRAALSQALGDEFELDETELDWFAPALTLRGLRLAGTDAPLALDELELGFEWRAGELVPARLDVRGGRLELSEALLARWERARARRAERTTGGSAVELPVVVVEGLQLDWRHPEWGATGIGRADALYRSDAGGAPSIEGRVQPAFADAAAGPSPEIYLAGRRDASGRITLAASCAGVPISADSIPAASPAGVVRGWKPRARLSFDLAASFLLDSASPPAGRLRAKLASGSLQPPTTPVPVTDVELDLEALCAADSLAGLLDPAAWRSTAHVDARWSGLPLSAWALIGANAGPGLSARAWAHAPRLPLTRDLAAATGQGAALEELWGVVDPQGSVDALIGARWPSASSLADTAAALRPEVAVELDLGRSLSLCYHGLLNAAGTRRAGFPLRVDGASGRVVALHDVGGRSATRIGILEILGAHSRGRREERPGFAHGLLLFPAEGDRAHPWLDLRVGGHGVPVDDELERGLNGLPGTAFIFPTFSPSGGSASIVARLYQRPGLRWPAAQVDVELFGVDGAWSEVPVGLEATQGRIEFRSDPRGLSGTGFDLLSRTRNGARVRARGRLQDLAVEGADELPWQLRRLEAVEVDLDGVALRGEDRDAIVSALPEVGSALAGLGAAGRVDVRFRMGLPELAAPRVWRAEVEPRDAELLPARFPVQLNGVRGRVLVDGAMALTEEQRGSAGLGTRTRIAPLVGRWVAGGTVATTALFPVGGDGRIELFAASVDLANPSLIGAFEAAQSSGLGGGHAGPGLSSLNVTGRVDFSAEFIVPEHSPRAPESLYRVYLRENDVRTEIGGGRLQLGRLAGILEQSGDGLLTGERLSAVLAETALELRNASFGEQDGRFRVETTIDALRLPIDREHLAPFLDDATVAALVDDLGWSGEMDVRGAELVIESGADARGEARFAGDLVPRGMRIDFGVPIEVDTAQVRIEELSYGRDGVRARATVSGLAGHVSDRRLSDASLRLEYEESRLEILDLAGQLEQGRLESVERRADARPFFAIQLEPPYRFEAALKLADVEVGRLLRGLFESDFASRGQLDGELALAGDLERLTGITGTGRFEIEDTVLWSIPVVRELLSSLDVGSGSVFEHVEARLTIEQGRVRTSELLVESPLIKLVGDGTLDFDGALNYDLEVQYRILDWMGVFNRLIYWVQNSLVRVAIRGDMARPRVEIKGAFGSATDRRRGSRDLPLPALAPLPERF